MVPLINTKSQYASINSLIGDPDGIVEKEPIAPRYAWTELA